MAQVSTVGGMPREYQVDVDPERLRAFGVTLGDLHGAIARSNAASRASASGERSPAPSSSATTTTAKTTWTACARCRSTSRRGSADESACAMFDRFDLRPAQSMAALRT